MLSKRSQEGYLLIDNRCNEGMPDELLRQFGIDMPGGRGKFESATVTCKHCGKVQVLNPTRSRERGYCGKCDHYICDEWACHQSCRPLARYVDAIQERFSRPAGQVSAALDVLRNSICGF
ncbi:MAG TPA: hypothetical protein VND94_01025 [Terriglobia bacterium]|nr:hypothetical protein [Terriglobia bacterium]